MLRVACPVLAALPAKLLLGFDGSTEPRNPGGWATYGWCLWDRADEAAYGYGLAAAAGTRLATNNFAEWCALGFGLRWLLDQQWQGELQIRGDSMLVVSQLNGSWKCNKPHLQALRQRCWQILARIAAGTWNSAWIPRAQNERCDGLSRRAFIEVTGLPYPERKRKRRADDDDEPA
jgi:ribonuclease HI